MHKRLLKTFHKILIVVSLRDSETIAIAQEEIHLKKEERFLLFKEDKANNITIFQETIKKCRQFLP